MCNVCLEARLTNIVKKRTREQAITSASGGVCVGTAAPQFMKQVFAQVLQAGSLRGSQFGCEPSLTRREPAFTNSTSGRAAIPAVTSH